MLLYIRTPKKGTLQIQIDEFPTESMPGRTHTTTHDGYTYDVFKLIHLTRDVPVVEVKVKDLIHNLTYRGWSDARGEILTAEEVFHAYIRAGSWNQFIRENTHLHRHILKLLKADYRYPIITIQSGLDVPDGLHRLTRAVMDGRPTIQTRIVCKLPREAIMGLPLLPFEPGA